MHTHKYCTSTSIRGKMYMMPAISSGPLFSQFLKHVWDQKITLRPVWEGGNVQKGMKRKESFKYVPSIPNDLEV